MKSYLKKTLNKSASVVAILLVLAACNQSGVSQDAHAQSSTDLDLENEKNRLGYTIGVQIAAGMRSQNLQEDISVEGLTAGFQDVLSGKEPRLTEEQMQQVQIAYQQQQQAKVAAVADKNQTDGDAFLAKNAKADGVKVTDSGLQYEVLRDGKGKSPLATDTVKVHYQGTLTDGTKFDSSYDRGAPADFPVSGVIPGFAEGLQLMQEGAKYRFTIPAAIAYGADGPPSIGPNQVLVFEVEMIEVVSQSGAKKEG